MRATIDGPCGLVPLLRQRWHDQAMPAVKRRYYVWNEAHVMLRHDPDLFGQLVDAIMGVAAEAEYASDDLLLIHRAVFVGSPALDVYAEDPRGQFRGWRREGHERPLWEVVSGQRRPRVKSHHIQTRELLGASLTA